MGDFNYGKALVRDLGSLARGGKIKLSTETGQTNWKNLSADKLRRIAAIVAEPEPETTDTGAPGVGPDLAVELLLQWLKSEPQLLKRAKTVAAQDAQDESAIISYWVPTVLFGTPEGPFDPGREPKSDGSKVATLRDAISRGDLLKVDWELFGDLIKEG